MISVPNPAALQQASVSVLILRVQLWRFVLLLHYDRSLLLFAFKVLQRTVVVDLGIHQNGML